MLQMKLYPNPHDLTHWFALDPQVAWVLFPAEINGWLKRQRAKGTDVSSLIEVPLRTGFNTGIPGAAGFGARTSRLCLRVAARWPARVPSAS